MTLAQGTKLGSFEILSLLGAGGMGEVYRVRDTKLGREVAIKVLPEDFAQDPERMARFEREATLLASLDHPNIGTLYDFQESNGYHFLVMQLIEGETLDERIERGPVSVQEAIPIFIQIAQALEAAHDRDIIHRDLKPANIKITPEGKVVVLDFGIAKSLKPLRSLSPGDPTRLADRGRVTTEGIIIGTPSNMSPEQARGQAVDKRTDIWAFGCCLYETISGELPFKGDTSSEVLAKVLEREPDWDPLPRNTPEGIQNLVFRCLRKDPDLRLHDIADARIELIECGSSEYYASTGTPLRRRRKLPWRGLMAGALAGLLVGLALGALLIEGRPRTETEPPRLRRFSILLPDDAPLARVDRNGGTLALSPDGSRLVYVAELGSKTHLFTRLLDENEARPMPGTEAGRSPFFSPDGQWVAFFTFPEGKLKKVSVHGGAPLTLYDKAPMPRGGTWGPNDTIVIAFESGPEDGLMLIPLEGGPAVALTTPNKSLGEVNHVWPTFLPGGKEILFTIGVGSNYDNGRIALLSLETGRYETLIEGGSHVVYANSGHLVYARSGSLMAATFDPLSERKVGLPVPVLEGIQSDRGTGRSDFVLGADGSLFYAQWGSREVSRNLVWVDSHGQAEAIGVDKRIFRNPRISPDGTQLAFHVDSGSGVSAGDVWLYDLKRGVLSRRTFEGDNYSPSWHPQGGSVIFASAREGRTYNLFRFAVNGSGGVERLTTSNSLQVVSSISPDGRTVAFTQINTDTGIDIYLLDLESGDDPRPFLQTEFYESQAVFSPNGNWIAYASEETGRREVCVLPYPGPGRHVQISVDGGAEPVWSPDGTELFYRNGLKMMAVSIEMEPTFGAGTPRPLFEGSYYQDTPAQFDVARDGRFLMIEMNQEALGVTELVAVEGWLEELKRLAPRPSS